MIRLSDLFRIRREERWLALAALLLFVGLTAVVIVKYYALFSVYSNSVWGPFPKNFHVSGFDALVYTIVSRWNTFFTVVFRHPLLAFLLYPFYAINQGLYMLTGINCVQFVVAVPLIFCAFYSVLFLYRIFREVVGLKKADSIVLSALSFSFAYMMLSVVVPEHFIFSTFMLTLTLYIAGLKITANSRSRYGERHEMSTALTVLLFFLTAGLSLTNGVKTFLAQWFVNGRRFFRPANLIFGVLLPVALLLTFSQLEYKLLTVPGEKARAAAAAAKAKKTGKAVKKNGTRSKADGEPMTDGLYLQWSDVTTSRGKTIVHNLFGESIQLHEDHLLRDAHNGRPVFVGYNHVYNYVVEGIVVFFFLAGIWFGRRERFLWLALSFFAVDMVLHLGFGFAINEIYITGAHWLFVIPIAIAYIFKAMTRLGCRLMRVLMGLLALWLWTYNGYLFVNYMLEVISD